GGSGAGGPVGGAGGPVRGEGFGEGPGFYVTGRFEEVQRRGLFLGHVVREIRVEDPGARGILAVQERLEEALRSERVRGVLLRMQGGGMGMAYAQELRQWIQALEEANKRVVCVLGDATGSELYACASAHRLVIDPAGDIRIYGPWIEVQHYAGLLEQLGVRADFLRIGPHKSAIEAFHNRSMSEESREDRSALLSDLWKRFVAELSRDRRLPPEVVREIVENGPHLAAEAHRAGLVDGILGPGELKPFLRELFGGEVELERVPPREARRRFADPTHVGVVVIDGELIDGDNLDIPILDIHATGARTALRAIERFASDPAIGAIVVRIDSPGGSVLASDQIHRAIRRARERKPVIASMGSIAASGGYYIASACQEIWADPATITGSIGIWYGKVDFAPLLERFGVFTEELRSARRGGMESLFRPFTPEERASLAEVLRSLYRLFVRRVAEGRAMPPSEVDARGRGRIFSGDRAKALGLVDRLGGFGAALARARKLAELPEDAGFEVAPSRPSSLLDYALGAIGPGSSEDGPTGPSLSLPEPLLAPLRAGALLYLFEGRPLALLPFNLKWR
ncbi:MAG: signal peptide peptidase SppA, partial [Sandaracinaceae bacterium]|nr:signal peptide peptidase SppA [Sandaracinaceae bacterium]